MLAFKSGDVWRTFITKFIFINVAATKCYFRYFFLWSIQLRDRKTGGVSIYFLREKYLSQYHLHEPSGNKSGFGHHINILGRAFSDKIIVISLSPYLTTGPNLQVGDLCGRRCDILLFCDAYRWRFFLPENRRIYISAAEISSFPISPVWCNLYCPFKFSTFEPFKILIEMFYLLCGSNFFSLIKVLAIIVDIFYFDEILNGYFLVSINGPTCYVWKQQIVWWAYEKALLCFCCITI